MSELVEGLYAAYRAKTEVIDLALAMISEFVNNRSAYEPRAHVTVIYSKADLPYAMISPIARDILKAIPKIDALITGIELFDSPSTGHNTHTIVLTLESAELSSLHNMLLSIGLTHDYKYQPHITIGYGLDKVLANKLLKECKEVTIGGTIKLDSPYVEPLNVLRN